MMDIPKANRKVGAIKNIIVMDIIANLKTNGFDKITSENVKDLLFEVYKYHGTVYESVYALERVEFERAERPKKPLLASKHTSKDALEYAQAMAGYEKLDKEYRKVEKHNDQIRYVIHEGIKLFILEDTGANKLPELNRNKVWEKAYSDKQSEGMYAIYSEIEELVGLYEGMIPAEN